MIEYRYNEKDYNDYYDFLDKIGYAVDPNYIFGQLELGK